MMKLSQLCLTGIVLVLLGMHVHAQSVDMFWGGEIDATTDVLKILGRTEDGHYALSGKGKNYFIEYYSGKDMTMKFSTEIVIPKENDKNCKLAEVYFLDGQLSMLTYSFDRSDKTYHVYGYLLDSKGKIKGKAKELAVAEVDKGSRRGELDIKISRDRSKMALVHSAPHRVKAGVWQWKVKLQLLSSNLDVIITKEEIISMEKEDDAVNISDFVVGNDGGMYLAASQVGYDRAEKIWATKSMDIYRYAPFNGFESEKIPIRLGEDSPTTLKLTTDQDGDLVGGGFYAERVRRGLGGYQGIAGSYFFQIRKEDDEARKVLSTPFNGAFAEQLLSEKQAEKGRMVPDLFVPRQIIPRSDGGVVMVAEYYQVVVTETRAGRTTTYIHGPIVVASMNAKGEVDWVKAIAKAQVYSLNQPAIGFGVGGGGSFLTFSVLLNVRTNKSIYHSYLMSAKDDKLYFIYNDNPKNMNIDDNRKIKPLRGYNGAVPISVVIDSEGNVSKELLLDKDRSEVVMRPKIHYQEEYGEILVYGSKRAKDKFGLINF